MNNGKITVYGTTWCGDCHRATFYLDRERVPYEWIDIGKDDEALGYVERVNGGMRSVPTIVFPDESILVEPSVAELAEKLRSLGG